MTNAIGIAQVVHCEVCVVCCNFREVLLGCLGQRGY